MHIYRGQFNLGRYAENEAITLIVPHSFLPDNTVCVSWKWTTTPSTCSDSHFFDVGTIVVEDYLGKPKTKITFLHDDYHFDTIIGSDLKSIVLILKFADERAEDPVPLHRVYVHHEQGPVETPSHRLFAGKVDCRHTEFGVSGIDETFLVVTSGPLTDNKPLCALWQGVDDRNVKVNMDCVHQVRTVSGTSKFSFSHQNALVFEAEMGEDGKRLAMTMKPMEPAKHEAVLDFELQEMKPSAVTFHVLTTITSTILNNSNEVLYCTLRPIPTGSTALDTAFNIGSLILSLAGVPSAVTTALKLLGRAKDVGTRFIDGLGVASSIGGSAAGCASLKDYWEADDSVIALTLFPGDKVSRIASDGTDNLVQFIRAYITPDNTIKIEALEKAHLGNTTSFVTNFITGTESKVTTTELLQFGLPPVTESNKHIRSDHRLTTFPQMKPNYHPATDAPIIPKLPDIVPAGFICSIKVLPTTENEKGFEMRQYETLNKIIKTAKEKVTQHKQLIFSYDPDLSVHHNPMPGPDSQQTGGLDFPFYELESLKDGRPVLKLKNCVAIEPVSGEGLTVISGETDTVSKVLRLIYDNPKNGAKGSMATYHWAYRVGDANKLWGFRAEPGVKVTYRDGATTYLVASSGPVAFRKIHVVSK